MKAKRVGAKAEELGRFVNGLREYLGLDPLHRPSQKAKRVKSLGETDTLRFGATIPDPWQPSRTPIRKTGMS